MKRVKSTDLQGANAYFTNFDYRIVSSVNNIDVLERDIERKLKVLLLTKNNVVCAASHLINPVSYKLLSNNPILLEKELIIPAFRSDKKEFYELFDGKIVSQKDRILYTSFYAEYLSKTVSWEVQENSSWFRDTFVQGLMSEKSVIRKNLAFLSKRDIDNLIAKVLEKETLDRGTVEKLASKFDDHSKIILNNYRELLYHMSGARVVNCESTLPQENYIDYSFTDLKERKTQLSELQVFWKIYLELLLETLNRYRFPVEALDYLSFSDIYDIRQPLLESDFIENYNRFYEIATNAIIKDSRDDILYDSSELMKIKNSLEKQYKEIFDKQLHSFFKKRAINEGKELLKNTANMGLGFIPFSNLISGLMGVLSEIKSTYFNVLQMFRDVKSMSNYEYYTKSKTELLHKEILKFDIGKGTEMIDIVELIQYVISSKSRL